MHPLCFDASNHEAWEALRDAVARICNTTLPKTNSFSEYEKIRETVRKYVREITDKLPVLYQMR